jgi:hypothetical protein
MDIIEERINVLVGGEAARQGADILKWFDGFDALKPR